MDTQTTHTQNHELIRIKGFWFPLEFDYNLTRTRLPLVISFHEVQMRDLAPTPGPNPYPVKSRKESVPARYPQASEGGKETYKQLSRDSVYHHILHHLTSCLTSEESSSMPHLLIKVWEEEIFRKKLNSAI